MALPAQQVASSTPTPLDYVRAGFALVPIPRGGKKPITKGWNERENAITTIERAAQLHEGVGLLPAWSRMVVIDIDRLTVARPWFAERNIDIDTLLGAADAVKIWSGRDDRIKLVYRVPDGVDPMTLWSFQRAPYVSEDGKEHPAVEFHCSTRTGNSTQDVLPCPTGLHPDTGKPYVWIEGLAGDWRDPPMIPEKLLELWWSELKRVRMHSTPSEASGKPHALTADDIRDILSHIEDNRDRGEWLKTLWAARRAWSCATVLTDESVWITLLTEWSQSGWSTNSPFDSCEEEVTEKWMEADDRDGPGVGFLWNSAIVGGFEPTAEQRARLHNEKPVIDWFDDVSVQLTQQEAKPKLQLVPARDFAKREPVRYLVDGLIEEGELFGLIGQRKAAKSYVALDLAFAVARGRAWAGRDVIAKGPVVWIAAEGARSLARRRLPQWLAHHGDADIRVYSGPLNLQKKETRDALLEACRGARLVVIDSLRRVAPGAKENSSDEFSLVLANAEFITLQTGAAVCLIAHAGKGDATTARGSSAIEDQLEAAFAIEKLSSGTFRMTAPFARDESTGDAKWNFGLAPITPEGLAPGVVVDWNVPTSAAGDKSTRKLRGVPKVVLQTARDLMPIEGGWVEVEKLVQLAVQKLPDKKQATRDVNRAIKDSLIGEFIEIDGGKFRVL